MQQKLDSTRQPHPDANSNNSYTIYSQPWWSGLRHDAISPEVLGENTTNLSPPKHPNGRVGTVSKSQAKGGLNGEIEANKDMQVTVVSQSGADGNCEQEQQHVQHAACIMPPTMGEYLTPSAQLELVGHSIACAPYQYSDPNYGGVMPAYGPQALVHPHFLGLQPTRMALPIEMTEEPVYVNAKQYHGILRRRQSRAKAELEKKLIKARKPYLHESRHLHAMRRVRGCGGRFVNTKKLDSTAAANATQEMGTGSKGGNASTLFVTSSSSKTVLSNSSGNADLSTDHREVKEPPFLQEMLKTNTSFSNGGGNSCYLHHQGFQFSTYHSLSDDRVEEGDCSGKQRERIVVNGNPHRALTIT